MKAHPCLRHGLTLVLAATFTSVTSLRAQDQPLAPGSPPPGYPVAPNASVAPSPIEELVAPIALYPDALIALILPASTASSDIVIAARFLKVGGTANQIDTQPWDDSVKGLAHYPEVVAWMDENLSWTQRLGQAYLDDPQAVMNAVQQARARARTNGVLVDTQQQQVVVEDSYIRIIPAQPDVIYVPRYDPEIIYVEQPTYYSSNPWLTFGIGFGVGSWLAYDLDWHHHSIWVDSHRHEHWREHRDWRYRSFPSHAGFVSRDPYWRQWSPGPGRPRPPHRDHDRWTHEISRPTPLAGAPRFDRSRYREPSNSVNHVVGGNRPGVQSAQRYERNRERTVDSQTRSIRTPGTVRNSAGTDFTQRSLDSTPQPVITGSTPTNQVQPERQRGPADRNYRRSGNMPGSTIGRTTAPTAALAPSETAPQPVVQSSNPAISAPAERQRGPADRSYRRSSAPSSTAGAVSVVPSERQVGTTVPAQPRSDERRRQFGDRGAERRGQSATPAMRSGAVTAPTPSVAATPSQAPVRRAAPEARQYQPQQRTVVSAPAPAPVVSAPAAAAPSYQAPARQPQVDRGSNGNNGGGNGRGEGRGRDRQSRD
ncbi:MAG: DUF3300 domain-containing protein [Opitutus sp.]